MARMLTASLWLAAALGGIEARVDDSAAFVYGFEREECLSGTHAFASVDDAPFGDLVHDPGATRCTDGVGVATVGDLPTSTGLHSTGNATRWLGGLAAEGAAGLTFEMWLRPVYSSLEDPSVTREPIVTIGSSAGGIDLQIYEQRARMGITYRR